MVIHRNFAGKTPPPQSLHAFGFKMCLYFGVQLVLHTAGLDTPAQSPALTAGWGVARW